MQINKLVRSHEVVLLTLWESPRCKSLAQSNLQNHNLPQLGLLCEEQRVGNSLSKLALSNALVQNANEKTINILTKMLSSLLSEVIETNIVPTNLLKILFREG